VLISDESTQLSTTAQPHLLARTPDGLVIPNTYSMREGQTLALMINAFKPPKDDVISLALSGDTDANRSLSLSHTHTHTHCLSLSLSLSLSHSLSLSRTHTHTHTHTHTSRALSLSLSLTHTHTHTHSLTHFPVIQTPTGQTPANACTQTLNRCSANRVLDEKEASILRFFYTLF
jgi:hypothetical protein